MCIEESLGVKLPTTWTDETGEVERVREEKKKNEDQKRERVRRCRCAKGRKVAKPCFSNVLRSRNWKVGSLRWDMNNCTPMWREPDLEVKGVKPRERRNAFGTGDVGKVRAAVTRTTRGKSKRTKRLRFCAFRSWDDQKCSLLRREAHFEFKLHKASNVRITFARWSVADRGRCNGFCIVSKMNNGGHGVFEESLQRWISRGRRNTRDISIRHVKRSGPDFLRRVAFWSIRSSGLLRWFCVTGAALRMTWLHFFMANAIAR